MPAWIGGDAGGVGGAREADLLGRRAGPEQAREALLRQGLHVVRQHPVPGQRLHHLPDPCVCHGHPFPGAQRFEVFQGLYHQLLQLFGRQLGHHFS